MNVLLYSKMKDGAGRRLQNVIEALVPAKQTEICRNMDSLARRLRQLAKGFSVAVLLAAERKELGELLSIHELFRDIRIILILPDTDNDTIATGHRLYPRYVSYVDSDFKDVAAVLGKMLELLNFAQGEQAACGMVK